MKNIFTLSHVVLYAKGWYTKTDDIWADLKKILQYDDYTPFTNNDVYNIILHRFEESNIYRITSISNILNEINPYNCWKLGYCVEENRGWFNINTKVNKYDMETAFIYYVLNNIRFIDKSNWIPKIPKYSKDNPRPKNKSLKSIIETFNKK